MHIGVIWRIHLMIGPDPPTQFILYVFYGAHGPGWSRPRQENGVFSMTLCGYFTCCVRSCIVMHENARYVILHEMTNYHLCANPVKTSNNGCRLKRLLGWVNVLTWKGRNVVTRALQGLARTMTYSVLLYGFIWWWKVCLEQPKWCAI